MKIADLIEVLAEVNTPHVGLLEALIAKHRDIFIIGNGGSNAVASHIAQDLTKCNGKRAHTFSDASRLTCYMNDYGLAQAYAKYLSHFADQDSLAILISSSGKSENILNAAEFCCQSNIPFVILSGFDAENPLRTRYRDRALLEFWVDSHDYGVVECAHHAILHSAVRPAAAQGTSQSATTVTSIDLTP